MSDLPILPSQELLFFDSMPQMLPTYMALKSALLARCPDMETTVSKTQISFRNRRLFAMASLPWRKRKGWPEEYLLISFGLGRRKASPRIVQAVEPYPNRWTHHVLATGPEAIDGELLRWLDEAYRFAEEKERREAPPPKPTA